jgi:acetyltransferase-like isoleucine patch superfamily enzyme
MILANAWQRLAVFYYRAKYQEILRRAAFGRGLRIWCKLQIKGPGYVRIGKDCRILPTLFCGAHVTLYTHTPEARIEIGDRVVLRGTRIGCHKQVTIENEAVIDDCSLFDSDFHNIDASRRNEDFQQLNRPVVIGAGSYIGTNALIGKGTMIGAESIVLPATFVTGKRFKTGSLIGGFPGKWLGAVDQLRIPATPYHCANASAAKTITG